jgi:DNA-binding MarR family transcriptional regulator
MTMTQETPTTPPLPRFPEELIASTAFLLKKLGMSTKERAMEAYGRTGLNPYHHAILVLLGEGSRETQGAIADALGYDRGQLVGLLDELEEQGLVERRRDPSDRRRHLVRLTADGRRALGRLRTLSRRLEDACSSRSTSASASSSTRSCCASPSTICLTALGSLPPSSADPAQPAAAAVRTRRRIARPEIPTASTASPAMTAESGSAATSATQATKPTTFSSRGQRRSSAGCV